MGRELEFRRLGHLLEEVRRGAGGTLLVRGEPGVGKTEMLSETARRASDFHVTAVRGTQSESDLAFAGLATLVRPFLARLDDLPSPQRHALASALALSDEPLRSPHAAYLGLLTLLEVAAELVPQLVLVDDIQWLDQPSRQAVLFAARRVGADRVAVILAARDGDHAGEDLRGLPELQLGGLEPGAAREVLRRHHPDLATDVADALTRAMGGVPLALIEVPRLLSADQRRGLAQLPDPLPAGKRVQDAFRRSLASMPPRCLEALLLLAADEAGSAKTLFRALELRGYPTDVLVPAERAGLIHEVDGSFAFQHPLLRSTVYYGATALARRGAHGVLAVALENADQERRAWQLAAATVGEDADVAQALEEAGRSAARRGGYASAATAYERSGALTPDPELRARRLLEGAEACRLGGLGDRALRLLDRALVLTVDPLLRADIQLLRGRILFAHRSVLEAYSLFVEEARRIESEFPDRAATMLTEACWACTAAARVDDGLRAAQHAYELGRTVGGTTEVAAALSLAEGLLLAGRGREARRILDACKGPLERRSSPLTPPFSPTSAMSYVVAEDYAFAATLFHAQVAAARELAAPALLSFVLASRAEYSFRIGDWASAYADGTEALALAGEVESLSIHAFVLITLARIEAGLGRDEAIAHADQGERLVARHGHRSLLLCAQSARALLHVGAGRIEEAIVELEETARLWELSGAGDPTIVQWMPDLIEAYARAGRPTDAANLLKNLEDQAETSEGRWAHAVAARSRGVLADADFETHFMDALALHAESPTPFEQARTELLFGERLRRAGRRTAARPHLRAALATFRRLGARGWTMRAETELGGSVERHVRAGLATDRLSPQELQVAFQVAAGATNAEAAAALFVTRKTIEFHLRNVYRKLGIRSRTELAGVIAFRRSDAESGPSSANS